MSNEVFESVDEIKPILEFCKNHKKPLVIISPHYPDDVSAFFTNIINNKIQELTYVL
jgi:2-hydroxy-3-keto-5-methylthiopentenyl-1-phosphate phosphatase